jgi:hypothetical protein
VGLNELLIVLGIKLDVEGVVVGHHAAENLAVTAAKI